MSGKVDVKIADHVARVQFFHPKKNSLPGELLRNIAAAIDEVAKNDDVHVVVLESDGEGPFCAGASFDELVAIQDFDTGKHFFMGFALVILAMKNCPKLTIVRVQGKAVGGGVGVIAAADYAMATTGASIKLSELAIGIGPFVVGPGVERKVGTSAFSEMSIDADWRDAAWAKQKGLYVDTYEDISQLDKAVDDFAKSLAQKSPEAMRELKKVLWQGTENWNELLEQRAEISGKLVLSDFTKNAIAAFKKK
ncbi:enoyl-CoA hydratase/isomerase family protein [Candidatus Uabimicrobium amorphum]|uniref:Enoyl-CoA hydratase n=1 Tax=Uabimicrobium amorphum TaxID=2596890 RepID=A0A5S9ITJ8_UABAM|nr:enoyl-CoA hydratase/isomerase family protein [Candidatus Uabimicrobium amorphum]BBM87839.1 enoyl-CoA hydratase [Candidatus Uabimicrobium amorphum]